MVLSLCVGLLCEMKFGQEELCKRILSNVKSESVILFGKVCVWVLVWLFTMCAQQHHSRARRRGYLRFYRQMQGLKNLPFTVHSAGTTAPVWQPTPCIALVGLSLCHTVAVMLKEELVFFFFLFVCRMCSSAGCYSCIISTNLAHLSAAQHPCVGALGGISMSPLLHRYSNLSYISDFLSCQTTDVVFM